MTCFGVCCTTSYRPVASPTKIPVCVGVCFQFEEEELRDVPLLVFANKQDLPRAVLASDITEALRLSGSSRPVGVLCACVTFVHV